MCTHVFSKIALCAAFSKRKMTGRKMMRSRKLEIKIKQANKLQCIIVNPICAQMSSNFVWFFFNYLWIICEANEDNEKEWWSAVRMVTPMHRFYKTIYYSNICSNDGINTDVKTSVEEEQKKNIMDGGGITNNYVWNLPW